MCSLRAEEVGKLLLMARGGVLPVVSGISMGTYEVGLRERGRCRGHVFVAGGTVGELACRCGCYMLTGVEAQGHLQVKTGASEQAQQAVMPVGRNAREARGRPVVYCRRPESALTTPWGPAVSFWVRGGRAKTPPRIDDAKPVQQAGNTGCLWPGTPEFDFHLVNRV